MRTKFLLPLAAAIASAQVPTISMTSAGVGVTNAASFVSGIAPGGIITIFGTNLGAAPGQTLVAPGSPWPPQLGNTSVTMNGVTAPVYYVLNQNGSEQLSVQAPWSLAGMNSATVMVTTPMGTSTPLAVPVSAAQPGIFLLDGASSCATHSANGSIVSSTYPAAQGEYVTLYLTGMGAVFDAPATGSPALSEASISQVVAQVTIGQLNAPVSYSGLAPGFIGLYQINAQVPGVSGVQDVTVQTQTGTSESNVRWETSNIGKITVQGGTCGLACSEPPAPNLRGK
jgi:uncharacterized protein (TIGR03437 family)